MLFLVIYLAVAFLISSTMLVLTLMEQENYLDKPSNRTCLFIGLVMPAIWPASILVVLVALCVESYISSVRRKCNTIMSAVNGDTKRLKELSLEDIKYLHNAGKVRAISATVEREIGLELLNRLADKHLLE
jgi:ABC-type dipeptide/oligopeptide/nickel transport system permease component